MIDTQETLRILHSQIAGETFALVKLKYRASVNADVSRDIEKLQGAMDIKMALTEGLRKNP